MGEPLPISWWSLSFAALLLLANAGLSLWLSLGLEKKILVAASRAFVQLSLLGYVLVPIFAAENLYLTLAVGLFMIALSAVEGLKRVTLKYRGSRLDGFVALFVAALCTTFIGTRLVVGVQPWWQPRYLIPLLGMVLGNALTGVSLGLDRCLTQLRDRRAYVEALLGCGASPWEAAFEIVADAIRTGMLPILNTLSVVGLVTIPGMMTGQLLGGTPPAEAARYQIMILFLVAGATAIGVALAVLLSLRRLFDDQLRLRTDRLTRTRD